MARGQLQKLSIDQLVDRYAAIGIAQGEALLMDEIAKFNQLYEQKVEIVDELKDRAGDQRGALIRLYDHPNVQVRLNAAKSTLAVAPQAARVLIEAIAVSKEFPQAGDAGMTIYALDEGIFKPV